VREYGAQAWMKVIAAAVMADEKSLTFNGFVGAVCINADRTGLNCPHAARYTRLA